jgi:signal transduction histidine kinase
MTRKIGFAADDAGHLLGYRQTVIEDAFYRVWPYAKRYWFDAVVVAGIGISIAVAVEQIHKKNGPKGPLWFDVLASFVFLVPFLFRRRYPFGAPAAVGVAIAVISVLDEGYVQAQFTTFLSGIVAAFMFGMLRERRQALTGAAFLVGVVAVVAHEQGNHPGDFLLPLVVFGVSWIVGYGLGQKFHEADEVRERAARLEREREEEARQAVAEERARIARELHDIVGHSVSVMTVQAAGVRSLLKPEQEREREALMVIEQTGREALAEMRRLVGVLRRPEESPALAPQPSLENVDRLVSQAREAGLPVELRVEGERVQLPAGVDLTAYRLVQEGLTNAIKHARADHAEVLVRYADGRVELTVSDDGDGDGDGVKGGNGLVGMRERVSVYGGEIEAGPLPQGGFRLHATLPIT